MPDAPAEPADDEPVYIYKPSLMGAAWELRLKPEGLAWQLGRHGGVARYDRITRVRLSYRPVTLQTHRFLAEIWAADAPKIVISSASWRSIMEQERLDAAYVAFVTELHRRIGRSGGQPALISGLPVALYAVGLLVLAGAVLAFAMLMVRAFEIGAWSGVAAVGGFFGLFLWQVGNHLRRNRPRTYQPDALPAETLPLNRPTPRANAG